jgi:hypothetical protein
VLVTKHSRFDDYSLYMYHTSKPKRVREVTDSAVSELTSCACSVSILPWHHSRIVGRVSGTALLGWLYVAGGLVHIQEAEDDEDEI